jgi:hypothetical protein
MPIEPTDRAPEAQGFLAGFTSNEEYTLFWARKLDERVRRLRRLIELKAPGLIVASARRLAFEALMRLPAEVEDLRADFNTGEYMRRDEHEHLTRTGYYEDAEKALGEDDAGSKT